MVNIQCNLLKHLAWRPRVCDLKNQLFCLESLLDIWCFCFVNPLWFRNYCSHTPNPVPFCPGLKDLLQLSIVNKSLDDFFCDSEVCIIYTDTTRRIANQQQDFCLLVDYIFCLQTMTMDLALSYCQRCCKRVEFEDDS